MFEHISTALEEFRQCFVPDYVKDNHRVSLSKTVSIIEALVSEDARGAVISRHSNISCLTPTAITHVKTFTSLITCLTLNSIMNVSPIVFYSCPHDEGT